MQEFDCCVSIFKQEIALLQKISVVQDSVHQAVVNREWTDFDWKIAQINQFGEEFRDLETERVEIFAALKEKYGIKRRFENEEEPSFYNVAAKLPNEEGRELSGLYRELKLETLKLKAQNEALTGYFNEIKTVTAAWLDAIFPAKGGKLYNRKGVQASGDLRSVVFNHRI